MPPPPTTGGPTATAPPLAIESREAESQTASEPRDHHPADVIPGELADLLTITPAAMLTAAPSLVWWC